MRARQVGTVVASTALFVAALTGCSQKPPCPQLSQNDDGSYKIAAPSPGADVQGCEYEFDDGNLGTERDTDG